MNLKLLLLAGVFMPAPLFGAFSLWLTGGPLMDSQGTALPDGALIQIIVKKASGTDFSIPTLSQFCDPVSEVIIAQFGLNSGTSEGPGGFGYSNDYLEPSVFGVSVGDAILLRWWTDLTTADLLPKETSFYGEFRTDNVLLADGSTGAWFIPASGVNLSLTVITESFGGSLPNATGMAALQAIPEPSTYAAGAVVLMAAAVGLRRRKRA